MVLLFQNGLYQYGVTHLTNNQTSSTHEHEFDSWLRCIWNNTCSKISIS